MMAYSQRSRAYGEYEDSSLVTTGVPGFLDLEIDHERLKELIRITSPREGIVCIPYTAPQFSEPIISAGTSVQNLAARSVISHQGITSGLITIT